MSGFWSSIFGEEQKQASSQVDGGSPDSVSDASQNSWDLLSNSGSSLSPIPEEYDFIGEILQAESQVDTARSVNYGAVDLSNSDPSLDKRLEAGDSLNGIYYDPDLRSINTVDGRMESPQSLLVASDLNYDSGSDLGEAEDIGFKCCAGISNCMDSISKSFDNCVTSFFDKWMSCCCCDEDITDDNKTYKKVVSVEV